MLADTQSRAVHALLTQTRHDRLSVPLATGNKSPTPAALPRHMTADPHFTPHGTDRVQDPLDDRSLLAAMAAGDRSAAGPFYDRHGAVVYGLALHMTRERADAEDVVLDVFAQVWREASRFDATRGSVMAWLTTITRTRALDHLRARQRRDDAAERASVFVDTPVAMGTAPASPTDALEQSERVAAVQAAMGALPRPQRQAIELAYFEGLTHHEVAATLQEPLGTIKTRIRLGLLKLRERLAGHAPEDGP